MTTLAVGDNNTLEVSVEKAKGEEEQELMKDK